MYEVITTKFMNGFLDKAVFISSERFVPLTTEIVLFRRCVGIQT